MLEKQLAAAKAKRKKQFLTLFVGFVIVVAIMAMLFFYSERSQTFPEKADANVEITKPDLSMPTAATTATVSNGALRQQYIDALTYYDSQLQPRLDKIDLERWQSERNAQLTDLKQKALGQFGEGNYINAVSYIKQAATQAETLLTEAQDAFAEVMMIAENAYQEDDLITAQQSISTALILDQNSADAAALANRIEQLADILPLLEQINTARIENQYEKERRLLSELIKLAPERESAVARKKEVMRLINDNNFARTVSRAYRAIDNENSNDAKKHLAAAKRIYAGRQELNAIQAAISELERKQRLQQYLGNAVQAVSNDNWQKAVGEYRKALNEQAGDKQIQQSIQKAESIVKLRQTFSQHINYPYRLSNPGLLSQVKQLLNQAEQYRQDSRLLAIQSDEVSTLINTMNTKVPVQVLSDNQTQVLVRGVGIVGMTESKTIELLPGEYTFEGKRKGYKSKLINVLIPYDKPGFSLTVICDEPI